jgi:NAD(P)-dependent dehydrogenase (short-subunit alcohol dehydrogenase family)
VVDLTPAADGTGWRSGLLRTVGALRGCYEAWSAETAADRIFYLAVTRLGGGMGYHALDGGGRYGGIWAGLAKTLHRELPNCNARVLDVGPSERDRLPELIAAELLRRGPVEVGHRDGCRWTLSPRPEPPPAPRIELGPDDLIVVSGGGRGIGWLLARGLAHDFGVRVVVTGRDPLPDAADGWHELSSADLEARLRARYTTTRNGRTVADIRREGVRIRARWELARNLAEARSAGLTVEYAACDITDPDQVRALFAGVGERVTGVVHNAGIDHALRLPKATDDQLVRTVRTKVDGFTHLFEAVRDRNLKFFCNVGSLTGRLGGMVGQFGYAAANEGLARLGLAAAARAPFPVMTLCWPTWNRVGLIANFEASLRYMPALDVAEGIAAWRSELLGGTSGEVTFVGPLGRALDPGQAVGYPVVPQFPGFTTAYPKIFHLGDVRGYRPGQELRSVVTLRGDRMPAIGDFQLGGTPGVPVSVLLENAIRAAEWTLPEQQSDMVLRQIRDVRVPLRLLLAEGATATLERRCDGRYVGTEWRVEVRYRRTGSGGPEARLSAVFTPAGAELPDPEADGEPAGPESPSADSLAPMMVRWRGRVVPLGAWHRHPDGRAYADVRPVSDADWWVDASAPRTALPLAALENVVRAVLDGHGAQIRIDRLSVHGTTRGGCRIEAGPELVWHLNDSGTGRPLATVTGLRS